jgi:hypothetical protein
MVVHNRNCFESEAEPSVNRIVVMPVPTGVRVALRAFRWKVGMLREEGQDAVALQNAVGDGAPPFVTELDLALVEPDVVPALFQISLDAADEFLVAVVAVTEKDAERGNGTEDI